MTYWVFGSANVLGSVKLPPGYRLEWAGDYESQKRSQKRLALIIPLTLLVILDPAGNTGTARNV